MVDEKPIPFVPALAVPAQGGGHRLALFPGVDKNQALFPPGVFKNISDSRVRVQRRFIGLFLQYRQRIGDYPVLGSLCALT